MALNTKEKEDERYVGHCTEGTRRDAFLDVSDEVLEVAAGAAKVHFTLGYARAYLSGPVDWLKCI